MPLSDGAKPDEVALWAALEQGEWPRYAGQRLGIPRKRVDYLCEKWADKGIYDYGVTCDLGWPDPDGAPEAHDSFRNSPPGSRAKWLNDVPEAPK